VTDSQTVRRDQMVTLVATVGDGPAFNVKGRVTRGDGHTVTVEVISVEAAQ
jgi:hypothetical protein